MSDTTETTHETSAAQPEAIQVESTEKNEKDKPLLLGMFLDFGQIRSEGDSCVEDVTPRQKAVIRAVRSFSANNPTYKAPYMAVDLAARSDVGLLHRGQKMDPAAPLFPLSAAAVSNPSVKVIVSAHDVVDVAHLASPTQSVLKTNPAFPVYTWFQAANLILDIAGKAGRVIPFPLDQDDGSVMFHALRVDPAEYKTYQEVLAYAVNTNGLKEGFDIAARLSYEILSKRGLTELTAKQVDHIITHVMLKSNAQIRGVILENAGRDEIDDEAMRDKISIFF